MPYTGSRKDAERRRFRAMTLLDQGRSPSQVADQLGVTRPAVSHWIKARNEHGQAGLKAKAHHGRPPKLTAKQIKKLEQLLLRGPTKQGYKTELWTLSRVASVIEKQFGVTYVSSGVFHLLQRLGWSCQKPERRARERDEEAIIAWRKIEWPRIKKRASKRA